jgi:hypothetical protein
MTEKSWPRHHDRYCEANLNDSGFCSNPDCSRNPPPAIEVQLITALLAQVELMNDNMLLKEQVLVYQAEMRRVTNARFVEHDPEEADVVRAMLQHLQTFHAKELKQAAESLRDSQSSGSSCCALNK